MYIVHTNININAGDVIDDISMKIQKKKIIINFIK